MKFLGHVVNESGVSTDPDKTKVIRDWVVFWDCVRSTESSQEILLQLLNRFTV